MVRIVFTIIELVNYSFYCISLFSFLVGLSHIIVNAVASIIVITFSKLEGLFDYLIRNTLRYLYFHITHYRIPTSNRIFYMPNTAPEQPTGSDQRDPVVVSSPPPSKTSTWGIEFIYWLVRVVVEIFFREISLRGSFNIPTSGPTLVVIAPHANQFLDAAISMYAIHMATHRITHFIEAAVSLRRRVIGPLSKMAGSIPVERPQDLLKLKEGLIKFKDYPNDKLTIIGKGTHFTQDCGFKYLIGLPHNKGNVKVDEVISDTELRLLTPMKKQAGIQILQSFTPYKAAPRVDNHTLFDTVFDSLHDGELIAIASEGGSHDRTELLPLKPGVAIMALGAINKYPGMEVKVVPCGMNYFHPHKFRSRAVLDFGRPIVLGDKWAAEYKENSRKAVSKLMDEITAAMKAVTVQSPDYETLQVIQAARRLYSYGGSTKSPPLPVVVEMNRNLLIGYSKFKDDPKIKHLKQSVTQYNRKLKLYGLRDHQVENASKHFLHNLLLLIKRLGLLIFYAILCLPGTILFSPVLYACKKISSKKQKEALANSVVKIKANDVLGSWKVLIALVFAPICYFTYSLIGTLLMRKYHLIYHLTDTWLDTFTVFCCWWAVLVCTTYAAFRMGEVGMDIAKSIRPLILSLLPKATELTELKEERKHLSMEMTDLINSLGPKVFPEFNKEKLRELSTEIMEENDALKEREPAKAVHRTHSHHHHKRNLSKSSTLSAVSSSSSESILTRERSASTASSVYSGFSEFGGADVGKLPNLSNVSIFPDNTEMSDVSSQSDMESIGESTSYANKATGNDLSSRVRAAVIKRNQAAAGASNDEADVDTNIH